MVTPTFFAGACIVFAATLAYGTTQTHLVFGAGRGSTCEAANCSAAGPVTDRKAGRVPYHQSATPASGMARGTTVRGATSRAPAGARKAASAPRPASPPPRASSRLAGDHHPPGSARPAPGRNHQAQ